MKFQQEKPCQIYLLFFGDVLKLNIETWMIILSERYHLQKNIACRQKISSKNYR
jgi:hypothetical protein